MDKVKESVSVLEIREDISRKYLSYFSLHLNRSAPFIFLRECRNLIQLAKQSELISDCEAQRLESHALTLMKLLESMRQALEKSRSKDRAISR